MPPGARSTRDRRMVAVPGVWRVAGRRATRGLVGVAVVTAVLACENTAVGPVPLGFGETFEAATHRVVELGFQGPDGLTLSGSLILPKEPGVYPLIVLHFGESKWTRTTYINERFWVDNGIAVLTYDKRGVGRSQGVCCAWQSPGYFQLHGGDVAAAVRLAITHPEIDRRAVGLFGSGHGGWTVPVAAAQLKDTIAFTYIASGPAVSVGEEILFGGLTGFSECQRSTLGFAEIDARLAEAGPSLFDPAPYVSAMTASGLWIYGANDLRTPVQQSVSNLERAKIAGDKDFTFVVLQGMNHNFVLDGGICDSSGPGGIDPRLIIDWLRPRLEARGATAFP